MAEYRWWRGLVARVTLTYAFGALALSALVALASFAITQNRLLTQVEDQHRRQAYQNMIVVRQRLSALGPIVTDEIGGTEESGDDGTDDDTADDDDNEENDATTESTSTTLEGVTDPTADVVGPIDPAPGITTTTVDQETSSTTLVDSETVEEAQVADVYTDLLGELRRTNGSLAGLKLGAEGFRSQTLQRDDVPIQLLSLQESETNPAQLRYEDETGAHYAMAVHFDDLDVTYIEILSLAPVESTLSSLRLILAGVAAAAALGGALLGYYSAKAALSPIPRISTRARALAGGDFSTKLDLRDQDRDLAVLADAFNDMIGAVAERIERERRFTTDVSHELRSPLMTLAASVEVLERRKESLPQVAQQAIDLLSHDLERFRRLVEDLLEVSRMEAGAVQLQMSRFRVVEFLENVIYQSRTPHLELRYDPDDAQVSITADKRRLAQVITNLLENAEKYGDGATGVRYEVVGENVQIIVADSGPGVPADQRERIFERFGRIEAGNRASAPGFGLGLSLVAEHVRLHGGRVWVTDRVDGERGARFVVQLPIGEHVDVIEEMAL